MDDRTYEIDQLASEVNVDAIVDEEHMLNWNDKQKDILIDEAIRSEESPF